NQLGHLASHHDDTLIHKVTDGQVIGGMRGIRSVLCDTSTVEPETGLCVRGIPIKELTAKTPEEIFCLLLTGELSSAETTRSLKEEFARRAHVPEHVWKVLAAVAKDTHPMTQLSIGIMAMQSGSKFFRDYNKGLKKQDYWKPMLEDCLDIIAVTPVIAAEIYRRHFNKGPRIAPDAKLDWSRNFAAMLGVSDSKGEFAKLMRLFLVLHCDHEGGPVSALSCAVVSSSLSDMYYSMAAGWNGLAGPLHGRANQECLAWILELTKQFGGVPGHEQIKDFINKTLVSGKVIPGYGHAVLRVPDPRFEAFMDFGKKHCASSDAFQTVSRVFDVAPKVLSDLGKVKNPWPNVDAASGSLLYHYGLKEFDYYTVLFAVSRCLGLASQTILARALGMPLIRPRSVTTQWLSQAVAGKVAV
ncbi:MAG: citrate (Si)-synthase, partial [Elusimicrobiota bacterium]